MKCDDRESWLILVLILCIGVLAGFLVWIITTPAQTAYTPEPMYSQESP